MKNSQAVYAGTQRVPKVKLDVKDARQLAMIRNSSSSDADLSARLGVPARVIRRIRDKHPTRQHPKTPETEQTPMKDTRDLRAFLAAQMQGVADGNVDMDKAKAMSNLAQQIYNTLNIEVKMAVAKSKLGDAEITPVSFGA